MSGKVRVAFLIDSIESPSAGSERQLLMLLEGLDRSRFEPFLCVLRSSPWIEEHFRLCPVRVLGVSSFKRPSAWASVFRFASWLRRERVHVLQLHFRDSSIAGVAASLLAPCVAVAAGRKSQGYWMDRGDLLLTRIMNTRVDVFVANSRDTAGWVERVEKVRPARIRVIHNGIDLPEPSPGEDARARARALLGVGEDAPVIGMVANLRPVKRVDVFVRAAALVRAARPDAVFVVAGEGPERQALEELARSLGLGGSLRLLGRRLDVPRLLPGFDVGVLTSDSESFSNSLLEFMAAGLPVVTTDVGGCREALDGSEAGMVVAPANHEEVAESVLAILGDPELSGLARSGHPARVREAFSRRAYVSAYEDLYRGLARLKGCSR